MFLGVICLLSAVLLWFLTRRPYMSLGLALPGALIVIALLIARWVKVSLHVAFAAFATALLWPIKLAVVAGVLLQRRWCGRVSFSVDTWQQMSQLGCCLVRPWAARITCGSNQI